MANITKHSDTFRIKESCGYDVNGKQVVKSMTHKPDTTKSDKWNIKELQRQTVLFKEACIQRNCAQATLIWNGV